MQMAHGLGWRFNMQKGVVYTGTLEECVDSIAESLREADKRMGTVKRNISESPISASASQVTNNKESSSKVAVERSPQQKYYG